MTTLRDMGVEIKISCHTCSKTQSFTIEQWLASDDEFFNNWQLTSLFYFGKGSDRSDVKFFCTDCANIKDILE